VTHETGRVALAEELLLLAYDDETGKATGSRIGLDLGMAAAVMVDLALAGRVVLDGAMLTVIDRTPVGESIADDVLVRLAAETPQSANAWVQRLRHGLRDKVLADLVARGIVTDVDETALEYIHVHRYPMADQAVELEVRARLTAALTSDDTPDERTAALATLVAAARMEPALLVPPAEAQAAHRRLGEIAERAGFSGSLGMENSVVRPSVALVIDSLYRAIDTALGRAAA